MVKPETQVVILRAQVQSMLIEAEERVGPTAFSQLDFDKLGVDELNAVKRALHEILYAPPPRNS